MLLKPLKSMNKKLLIFLSIIALLIVSCSDEATEAGASYSADAFPLAVYASINGSGQATTRAAITQIDDQWSYQDPFETDDVMGLYASKGNLKDNGIGPFENQELTYDGEKFTDKKGYVFSPTHMNGAQLYMYFPYSENMSDDGIELRKKVEEDDNEKSPVSHLRCIDFLSSKSLDIFGTSADNQQHIALYGTFEHAFSELIIMRGEGFNNPPQGKERITAVLNYPYTNLKVKIEISENNEWKCTPQLQFVENNEYKLDKENARRWNAWRGGNYGITGNDSKGIPAWYIIVPTLDNNRSIIEYIELYDNEGYLQRVSSLRFSGGNTKYVDPGWRYPIEIVMTELVPTVNPFPITPWGENVDLTDERARGINNEGVFAQWVLDYNRYLKAPDDKDKIDALLKYGDQYVDNDGKTSWHFYILSDLNLSQYTPLSDDGEGGGDGSTTPTTLNCIIPELHDVLDGISTNFVNGKFANHTITGLSKTFIGKMEGNGSVQNIDFIKPEIRNNEKSTSPAGIIVNEMEGNGTSVIHCNIDDGTMVNLGGPAGMVAGSMAKGGQVKDCELSGFLVTKSTDNTKFPAIVGQTDDTQTFTNNTFHAVIITNNIE